MTRDVVALSFLLVSGTTPPATEATTNGPLVVSVLAVITLAGTALTAMGPTFLEITKNRGLRLRPAPAGPSPPSNPELSSASNQMVRSAQEGLSMVEAAVLDYRSQRDDAMSRFDRSQRDLDTAREIIQEQAVYIAQLEGRLGIHRRTNGGRHGSPSEPQPWGRS